MPKRTLPVTLAAVMASAFIAHTEHVRTQDFAPTIRTHEELAAKGLLAATDEDFIKHAARANAIEIQAGKLAMSKTTNAEVRAFAETLVNDHTAAAKELAQWATKKNVVLKDDDPAVKIKLDKHKWLDTKTGADFDRQFVEAMISDHSDAVMLFSFESRNTKDPALKKFADDTLPAIRAHASMGRRLKAKLF